MKSIDFIKQLKRNGLKSTKHRTAILEILEKSSQPISAEQLYNKMQGRNISINLSTVYRTLEILCDKKLIIKLSIKENNRTLFELNQVMHKHHLVCLGCGKILAIDGCPLAGYEKVLESKYEYSIEGHNLNVYGYCPKCKKDD